MSTLLESRTVARSPAPARQRTASSPRMRMGRRLHKTVLLVHIVVAGAWIGLDVVMGTLVLTGVLTDDVGTRAVAWQAIELFAVWPMAVLAVATLASGVLLGLGTKYGLVRYWWVLVKLVMNVVLVVLVVFVLRGGVHELADQGRLLEDGSASSVALGDMAFPPIVSTTALLVASLLSVFKPWGRVRHG